MKQNNQMQLLAIILLFLLVIGSVMFVFPMQQKNKDIQLQKQAVVQERQEAQLLLEKLEMLSEEVAASESTKKALLKAVPTGLSQDELIVDLKELADEAEFNLTNMSFNERAGEGVGGAITVGASLTGTYANLVDFLERIEEADRLMRVSSINVQRTDSQNILFNLTIDAFYQ